MVIQDKEYNYTLGSPTPLGLLPQSVLTSRSHISSRFPFGIYIEKNGCTVASYRYVGAPVRQENHLLKVASQSPALSESVLLNQLDSRAVATQIVDSWIREVDVRVVPWCLSTSDTRLKGEE